MNKHFNTANRSQIVRRIALFESPCIDVSDNHSYLILKRKIKRAWRGRPAIFQARALVWDPCGAAVGCLTDELVDEIVDECRTEGCALPVFIHASGNTATEDPALYRFCQVSPVSVMGKL